MEFESATKHILLVDDNYHMRQVLKLALESHGYSVSEAECGAGAIRSARLENPDLILLDLNLPDMDGRQAAQTIKQTPSTAHIPIVGCSAYFGDEWRERALHAGMVDYLQKPVRLKDVEAAIEQFILLAR